VFAWVDIRRTAHVFDESLPGPDALHDADDATVVAAIAGWARVEAAAAARRLAMIRLQRTSSFTCSSRRHPSRAHLMRI
jgi:hypothetical protein